MNKIQQINSYGQLPAIGKQSKVEIDKNVPTSSVQKGQDQVQISDIAVYLNEIAKLPEVRTDKVQAIQQALAEGTYDIEGKLSAALDKFLDEYSA